MAEHLRASPADELKERQDHIVYALTIALVVVARTLGVDYQFGALKYMLQLTRGGSDWTAVLVACAAYIVFRLVRPFPFTRPEVQPPAGLLYWTGSFVVTLAAAASVLYLSVAVFQTENLARHRTAALALCIATITGFMLIEASLVRTSPPRGPRPVYIDAGLVSALLILPAFVVWIETWSEIILSNSGLGLLLRRLLASGYWGLWVTLGGSAFLLWWISMPARRRLRRSALYRSAVGALWIFGITAIAMGAVFPWLSSRRAEGLVEYWSFWYSQAGLLAMLGLWMLVAGAIYAAQRFGRPA